MNLKNNFLQGKTVLITREESQSRDICKAISNYGGVPITAPLLSFRDPDLDMKEMALALIENVNQYEWLILTSKNGVDFFFKFLKELGQELSDSVKIAVIGKKTLEVVKAYGFNPSFTPTTFVAENFLAEFLQVVKKDERVLICKGNLARTVIADGLRANGKTVDEAIVYVNEMPQDATQKLVESFTQSNVDIIFFTSASAVKNFYDIANKYSFCNKLKNCIIVGIGPITNAEAEKLGMNVSVKPKEYTLSGMLETLATYLQEEK